MGTRIKDGARFLLVIFGGGCDGCVASIAEGGEWCVVRVV